MIVTTTTFTVSELCQQLARGDIIVNRDYQRSPQIWPAAARSYLIDTILSGYPIPKISLYQKTDLRTRRTIKEIVDGQQRSMAISDFFNDELRITGKSNFSGQRYSSLEEADQQRFLDYAISADIFVGATDPDIREVFRRINSYQVPLSPQEKRHAIYQGAFKWFMTQMSAQYSQAFKDLGVFNERQLIRMNDAVLMTDLIYTVESGIGSASEAKLDDVYKKYEENFTLEEAYRELFDHVMSIVIEWRAIHKGPLMRPYNFYSLALALAHVFAGPFETLQRDFEIAVRPRVFEESALRNLSNLAAALEEPHAFPTLAGFVAACSKATNRITQRQERFQWMCAALLQENIV